jgi:hypothetical protein
LGMNRPTTNHAIDHQFPDRNVMIARADEVIE